MAKFKDMLKYLRNRENLSQAELADKIGMSKASISMYEVGKREPSFETLECFADFFNVDMNFLLGKTSSNDIKHVSAVRIPVLGSVPAGIPFEAIEDIIGEEEISSVMASKGQFFGLKIKGHSMEPNIMDEDTVIVLKTPTVDSGDIAIVMVNGFDATCKKVVRNESGIMLIPYNPTYDTMFYTNEEIITKPVTIIGRVVEIRRAL